MKKRRGHLFDVAMGSYDCAEICKLVGIFLLEENSETCNEGDIGLYKDDSLAIIRKKVVLY